MELHKLLQKQIKKYLGDIDTNQFPINEFINNVNQSYLAFERDRELMEHVFIQSEKEYNEINKSLKEEYNLKQQSIANLYNSLKVLEDEVDEIKNEDIDDLLYISKYLNQQIGKGKEIEKDLLTTVELLKTLLANLQSGILVEDENRKIHFTNQLFCDMFSIPINPDQMIGVDCTESVEQSKHLFVDSENFGPRITELLLHKKIVTNELIETVHGKFLERDYIPIFIKNVYKGHLWKYTDVTNRIKTQALLKQSEERNRLIMKSALNAIITINTKDAITFWNNQAEIIFGWKKEEVLGKSLADIIIPNIHKEAHKLGMKKFMETGEGPVLNKQIELRALHKNGNEFPIEISIIPIQQNNELIFCSFIQDISERKAAENNLKYQEEKYRNIIANMNLGLIEVDNNEIAKYVNQSFLEISGYEESEIIGKKPSSIFFAWNNEEFISNKIENRKKGISEIYQVPVKNKRGELRWWAISAAPNYDDKGNQTGSIGIHLDITSQKKLEIELEQEKIKAQEASKSKEVFLANMSHEIRTPLNAIIGFLRELSKQQLTELQKNYVENSSIASKHLLAIINNILDISKIEAQEMILDEEDFSLQKSITNVVNVLEPKATQNGTKVIVNLDNKIVKTLKGDPLRIEQILFNLIGNSIKFTSKGEITISTKLIHENPNSQQICITIKDTGIGMDADFVENIFKKFSQEDKKTTRKFGGTGLGMAITKELINLMNGSIHIESQKNIGTSIDVILNLPKSYVDFKKTNTSNNHSINIEDTKILLVEDNELNRMVAQNSLQYYNCLVTEAENGLEAIKALKKEDFDIILMDIQMPELDGIETTTIIRNELKLKTPIIALTANAFKSEIEKCYAAGINDYVTKPFDEDLLIEVIYKNLNKNYLLKNTKDELLYNLNSLYNLSRGNNDFVFKMIEIFIKQTEETIIKINDAIKSNEFSEVSKLIHKIKPSVEGMGIKSLMEDMKNLEVISKNKNDKEIIRLFEIIKESLQLAIVQLKENELKN
ncbi:MULTISPECIES: PAS domain-containing hybrid sensor histidine kinase/response regulator [Flavobacterium]|uniref:histidine kinase n=1 Tax=Flavobacterium hankyongi TaxID=1176532 RepID=A0ABP8ZR99_9FLAO|nr:PAS domain-containing hybrid sensor histidine kinase/response regulator [Flavobacterium sp. N1846]